MESFPRARRLLTFNSEALDHSILVQVTGITILARTAKLLYLLTSGYTSNRLWVVTGIPARADLNTSGSGRRGRRFGEGSGIARMNEGLTDPGFDDGFAFSCFSKDRTPMTMYE